MVRPRSSNFLGSEASSETTTAQRRTWVAACERNWKKFLVVSAQAGPWSLMVRAHMSTSSSRISSPSPCASGMRSRSVMTLAKGGVSRSLARSPPLPMAASPASPAIW
jgi:hypothetical protein